MSPGSFNLVTRYYWRSFTRRIRAWLSPIKRAPPRRPLYR